MRCLNLYHCFKEPDLCENWEMTLCFSFLCVCVCFPVSKCCCQNYTPPLKPGRQTECSFKPVSWLKNGPVYQSILHGAMSTVLAAESPSSLTSISCIWAACLRPRWQQAETWLDAKGCVLAQQVAWRIRQWIVTRKITICSRHWVHSCAFQWNILTNHNSFSCKYSYTSIITW